MAGRELFSLEWTPWGQLPRARDEKMDHTARHALRQQEAQPLLDKIQTQILALSKNVLPKSVAG